MTGDTTETGPRFAFGRNWRGFLAHVTDERIRTATESVRTALGLDSLVGRTFLDVGCGSGLFSLAAMNLDAEGVLSIDYDPDSVACAEHLRELCRANASNWTIEQGSALDEEYLATLGTFDVVYSWGVLHHTGDMWRGIDLVSQRVAPSGWFVLSIYNRQPWSGAWRVVKRTYVSGMLGRALVCATVLPAYAGLQFVADVARLRNPFARHWNYGENRGMSWWHDMHDWLGGYPFEVATPDEVFAFLRERGFVLDRLLTKGAGSGCNEFVFRRPPTEGA